MKPADHKPPLSWKSVQIQDRILHIPGNCPDYDSFVFPGWNHPNLFGNHNPVNIEYCSGNGAWIAAKAAAHPNINWVAVEKKYPRVRKIWSKIKNHNLSNLFIICGEGYTATSKYIPSASISESFINFPDPWPKTRHHKHRIVRPEFVNELSRIFRGDGTLNFVTDDEEYSNWTIKVMQGMTGFSAVYSSPHYVTEDQEYGTSYFEDLWRDKGRTIRYHKFRKGSVAGN